MRINDTVRVIAGDNKGKEAKIVKIDRKNGSAAFTSFKLDISIPT